MKTRTRTRRPSTKKLTRSPGEQKLVEKYKEVVIKPGSLMWAGHPDNPFAPAKAACVIICQCGAERTLATSDLHHCKSCRSCRHKEKIEARKAKRQQARQEAKK